MIGNESDGKEKASMLGPTKRTWNASKTARSEQTGKALRSGQTERKWKGAGQSEQASEDKKRKL